MSFKQKNKFIFFIFSILLISCSENKKAEVDNSKQGEFEILSDKSIDEPQNQKIVFLNGIKLAEYLPSNVPGTIKSPNKMGDMDDGNLRYTVASSEYVFPNNGFLKFSITDYGMKKFMPDYELKLFEKPPDESGKITEQIILPNGIGYCLWDESIREGSLFALVADRFIFRIDAIRLPQSSLKLQDYIKYFKIKELVNSISKS